MYYPGIRIKELRLKKGLSQDELAERLGMNRVNISHYERGKITNIPSDVLMKIAKVLNTNTDYILGLSDEDNSESDIEISIIQRAAKKMDPKDRKKMLEIMRLTFEDAFNDDEEDEDDDI
ncbi:helix-turn-helix transcriptional regulator [Niallia circulans]|jgi:transcriptional regulator with XRE-family HTH domain|uniref:helix-turn-helix domain-containing protein n=1 Tax=Niallia circulans TaxID=1397 RepID=UPI00201DA889|nr:helix-turn-helix transcriptional regulator [Niallia circulans]UQZ76821.1 XRE family transcriptional regulator [Niallia circulans]